MISGSKFLTDVLSGRRGHLHECLTCELGVDICCEDFLLVAYLRWPIAN